MSGNHDVAIDAVKQQLPSALPTKPFALYGDVALYQTGGFEDPRLVLYTERVGKLADTVEEAAK